MTGTPALAPLDPEPGARPRAPRRLRRQRRHHVVPRRRTAATGCSTTPAGAAASPCRSISPRASRSARTADRSSGARRRRCSIASPVDPFLTASPFVVDRGRRAGGCGTCRPASGARPRQGRAHYYNIRYAESADGLGVDAATAPSASTTRRRRSTPSRGRASCATPAAIGCGSRCAAMRYAIGVRRVGRRRALDAADAEGGLHGVRQRLGLRDGGVPGGLRRTAGAATCSTTATTTAAPASAWPCSTRSSEACGDSRGLACAAPYDCTVPDP